MTHRDLDDEPWPIPIRHEPPAPPPRRRYTESGRWFFAYVFVSMAVLATLLFMCVPSPFGVSPG